MVVARGEDGRRDAQPLVDNAKGFIVFGRFEGMEAVLGGPLLAYVCGGVPGGSPIDCAAATFTYMYLKLCIKLQGRQEDESQAKAEGILAFSGAPQAGCQKVLLV